MECSRAARAVAVVGVVLATVVGTLTVTASPAAAVATGDEAVMSNWVNDYRAAHGKPPLTLDESFSNGARSWSSRMASTGVMSHDPNRYNACAARFPNYKRCGENVGYASSLLQVQQMLQASSGHRANILCDCTHLAIGVVKSGSRYWVTQRFAHNNGYGSTLPPTNSPEAYFVREAYRNFLFRSPNSSELAYWTNRVSRNSTDTRTAFLQYLAYSDEWLGKLIDGYYQVALGRPADSAGKAYWANVIRSRRLSPSGVAAQFYASEEYFARRSYSTKAWVSDLYVELLARTPDSSGLSYWSNVAYRSGRLAVTSPFYDSPETLAVRVDRVYRAILGRRADSGGIRYWSGVIARTGNDVDLALFLASSAEYFKKSTT